MVVYKSDKKVRAFIIGDGEEREMLMGYCHEIGLDFVKPNEKSKGTVQFTSWITNADWANSGLDIVALSSLNEGTPVSFIEAQASWKPVVSRSK